MKSHLWLVLISLLVIPCVCWSQGIPTMDIPGTLQAGSETVETVKNSTETVEQVKTAQKTMAKLGAAKSSVSDFVNKQRDTIQKKKEQIEDYKTRIEEAKEMAEAYKAQAEEYKNMADEMVNGGEEPEEGETETDEPEEETEEGTEEETGDRGTEEDLKADVEAAKLAMEEECVEPESKKCKQATAVYNKAKREYECAINPENEICKEEKGGTLAGAARKLVETETAQPTRQRMMAADSVAMSPATTDGSSLKTLTSEIKSRSANAAKGGTLSIGDMSAKSSAISAVAKTSSASKSAKALENTSMTSTLKALDTSSEKGIALSQPSTDNAIKPVSGALKSVQVDDDTETEGKNVGDLKRVDKKDIKPSDGKADQKMADDNKKDLKASIKELTEGLKDGNTTAGSSSESKSKAKEKDLKSSIKELKKGLKNGNTTAGASSESKSKAKSNQNTEKKLKGSSSATPKPTRKTFQSSFNQSTIHNSYPLAFASTMALDTLGYETIDGTLVVPSPMYLFCKNFNYEQATKPEEFVKCMQKAVNVAGRENAIDDTKAQKESQDIGRDIYNGYVEYITAAYFEAMNIYNESLTFKNDQIDPILNSETADVDASWRIAKEMHMILGTRLNILNKLWSRELGVATYSAFMSTKAEKKDSEDKN